MKIWCFDDPQEWGKGLFIAARDKGHEPHLFDDPHLPDAGAAFYHMHHHPHFRKMHKHAVQRLALRRDLLVVPGPRAADLFDDKVAQAKHLAKWMPNTHLFYSPSLARTFIETATPFPFWSKAAEGTNGRNTRLVSDYEAAKLEIRMAFSDRGIKMHYGQKQIGYLLWQEPVLHEGYIYRVINVGNKRAVMKRYHNDPTARMVRRPEAINYMNLEIEALLAFADRFFMREGIPFGAIDIVRHTESGQWFVLGYTASWNMDVYKTCRFFSGTEVGAAAMPDIWHVFMDQLAIGALGEFQATDAA